MEQNMHINVSIPAIITHVKEIKLCHDIAIVNLAC